MTRQQRRAAERDAGRAAIRDRVTARVAAAPSVHAMWKAYYEEVLVPRGVTFEDPDTAPGAEWFRRSFYAGVSAMLELMMRVSTDDVTEDRGVEMLQRLYEELETYARGLR